MSRACRRLLRPGGRTAYLTIFVTPGLGTRDRRRAALMGPRAVSSRLGQEELLRRAGFVDIEEVDVTDAFLVTARALLGHAARLEPGLRATLGDSLFEEQQADRVTMVDAIEQGLLSRALLVGRAPG